MRALGLALVIALAACDAPSAEDNLEIVSDILCRCATFSPGEQAACVSKLEGELGTVSDSCVQCVEELAGNCPEDVQCAFECEPQGPAYRPIAVTKEAP